MELAAPFTVIPTLLLGASALIAQSGPQAAATSSAASPVARIYLGYSYPFAASSVQPTEQFAGYSADSEGRITPIAGGPWPGIAEATTGTWLFAGDFSYNNSRYVTSYKVDSAGALHEAAKYDLANRAPYGCEKLEGFWGLYLDHTGATLYATGFYDGAPSGGSVNGCENNAVLQSYRIDKETGTLTFLGSFEDPNVITLSLTFAGDNQLALGAAPGIALPGAEGPATACDCGISAFPRESNGLLVKGPTTVAEPVGTPIGQEYSAVLTQSDPFGHLAVWLDPMEESGNLVLAAYTVHSNGDVTTTNTVDQMPVTGYTSPPALGSGMFDMSISPSGKLLAVIGGGGSGLSLYHFNGADPITPYVTLLDAGQYPWSTAWDNANHLYVFGSDELYVFTVTPTSYSQAPGSPYPIEYGAGGFLVRAMTPQQ